MTSSAPPAGAAPAAGAPPANPYAAASNPDAFRLLVESRELPAKVANDLVSVIPKCKVIMVCDDSSSMNTNIAEEGKVAQKTSTRWLELQKIAAILIEFVVALCPDGLDVVFFNRGGLVNATTVAQLGPLFEAPPSGATPLCGTLRNIFNAVGSRTSANQWVLVLVITDGEPSDGTHRQLFEVLSAKHENIHVSFVECTDREEDMDYLDRWDGRIKNFDNNDDYREEVARVQAAKGQQFRFNRNDYVAKILLATFNRYYFNLDQGGQCCAIQ